MSISETVCQTADPSTCTDYCCSTMSQSSAPSWTPKRSHLTPMPSTGYMFLSSQSQLTCYCPTGNRYVATSEPLYVSVFMFPP